MYTDFYAKISAPFRGSGLIAKADKLLTTAFYLSYPLLIFALLLKSSPIDSPLPISPRAISCVIAPAAGFALVSLLRKLINAPRPYEKFAIEPLIIKDTKGQSFPSKHVYSSFAISICWFAVAPACGFTFVALAGIIACIRVVGGVHFPKDVAAGAVLGLAFGAVALLF